MASDWNMVSNQQSFIDQSIDRWRSCFTACLKAKTKHFEHLLWCVFLWYATVMTFKAYTTAVMNKVTYLSLLKVGWEQERWSILLQFRCKFTKVSVYQKLQKYYEVWQSYCKNKKYVPSNSESVQCNFFIFDHVTFIQFKICCCVQNFMKIALFFAEIWWYIDFQNGGRPPSWNCFTAIRDHPRSLCCWPQLPVKCHVNLIHRPEDIAIWIFRIVGLKCLSRAQKWKFWGTLDP